MVILRLKNFSIQFRLWGDHGQTSLERANICLVNASAIGTEILKSLVLPGNDYSKMRDILKVKLLTHRELLRGGGSVDYFAY